MHIVPRLVQSIILTSPAAPQIITDEDGYSLQAAEPGRIMAHHYIALPTMVGRRARMHTCVFALLEIKFLCFDAAKLGHIMPTPENCTANNGGWVDVRAYMHMCILFKVQYKLIGCFCLSGTSQLDLLFSVIVSLILTLIVTQLTSKPKRHDVCQNLQKIASSTCLPFVSITRLLATCRAL